MESVKKTNIDYCYYCPNATKNACKIFSIAVFSGRMFMLIKSVFKWVSSWSTCILVSLRLQFICVFTCMCACFCFLLFYCLTVISCLSCTVFVDLLMWGSAHESVLVSQKNKIACHRKSLWQADDSESLLKVLICSSILLTCHIYNISTYCVGVAFSPARCLGLCQKEETMKERNKSYEDTGDKKHFNCYQDPWLPFFE